jgi:hypothetical protein
MILGMAARRFVQGMRRNAAKVRRSGIPNSQGAGGRRYGPAPTLNRQADNRDLTYWSMIFSENRCAVFGIRL